MTRNGIITRSIRFFESHVLLVKIKDGSWRFCVDCQKLNDIIVNNKFPMSVIDEFLDELAGAKFFFNWTWHLVFIKSGWLMAVEDEINFQCISNLGLFPLKLTMSISNLGLFSLGLPMLRPFSVPNEFHFYSLDEEVCTLFMDDILVYSATMDDHITHLTGVFQVLL